MSKLDECKKEITGKINHVKDELTKAKDKLQQFEKMEQSWSMKYEGCLFSQPPIAQYGP